MRDDGSLPKKLPSLAVAPATPRWCCPSIFRTACPVEWLAQLGHHQAEPDDAEDGGAEAHRQRVDPAGAVGGTLHEKPAGDTGEACDGEDDDVLHHHLRSRLRHGGKQPVEHVSSWKRRR